MVAKKGSDNMIDQHMHSKFSPDSKVSVEQYLQKAQHEFKNEYINLTDHCDITKNLVTNRTVDFKSNFDAMELAAKKYIGEVMMGIEVGYNVNCEREITEFISSYDFSIVLLSIHDNDLKSYPYSQVSRYDMSEEEIMNDYFSQMKAGVSSNIDFDVLSHVGYVFRYLPTSIDPLNYLSSIEEVLMVLIEKDKALEINTSCVYDYKYDGERFYSEVLKLYKSLGGYKISLGSDSHALNTYCNHFDEAILFIKEHGFDELTIIKNRIHKQVSI